MDRPTMITFIEKILEVHNHCMISVFLWPLGLWVSLYFLCLILWRICFWGGVLLTPKKCTYLKCTIWKFLTYAHSHKTITVIRLQSISVTQKVSLCLFVAIPSSLLPASTLSSSPLIGFPTLQNSLHFLEFYVNVVMYCVFIFVWSLAQHSYMEVYVHVVWINISSLLLLSSILV